MQNKIIVTLIEDDAIIAENIKFTLEELGFSVDHLFYNYDDAFAHFSNSELYCDIIISDINLGEDKMKNGINLVRNLSAYHIPPVIFLTAYDDKNTILEASVVKPKGYLIKPINDAALFATISCAFQRAVEDSTSYSTINVDEYPEYFFAKMGNVNYKLFWEDVYLVKSIKNYVKLTMKDGRNFLIRGSLQNLTETKIPKRLKHIFVRINRSILINKNIIIAYDNEFVNTQVGQFQNTQYKEDGV